MRPGQRLLGLSDPIRTSEHWEVGPKTSLSRVRDAIQFRRPPTITLMLSTASVQDDETWSLENAAWCAAPPAQLGSAPLPPMLNVQHAHMQPALLKWENSHAGQGALMRCRPRTMQASQDHFNQACSQSC